MMKNISYHAQTDRLGRIALIATKIGFGHVIKEVEWFDPETRRYAWQQLTDTGIIIVMDGKKEKVVTAWIASVSQVCGIWGTGNTPQWLYKVAVKNKKYAKIQDRA